MPNRDFDLPPEVVTTGQLYVLLQSLNTKMSLQLLHQQEQEKKIDTLAQETEGLREAWKAAGTLLGFVKWVAAAAVACGVVWASFKGFGEEVRAWLQRS